MNVKDEVLAIIAKVLEVTVADLDDDTAIGDFPTWDSLHHLSIISEIEQKFEIQFTPDVLMDLEDVGDIVQAVEERV